AVAPSAANPDPVVARLAEPIGRPALREDPRYATHIARGENQRELDALIEEWTRARSRGEVLDAMERFGVPAGLIYRAPDILEDPHVQAREAIVTVPHPDFGELRMQNFAPKLSATPGGIRTPSPR